MADREVARAIAEERHQPGWKAYAQRLLGEAHLLAGRVAIAAEERGIYRSALAIAQAQDMRPLVARCRLGLGKLYRRASNQEQAHEHLSTATTMCREMGMTYWLETAETELRTA